MNINILNMDFRYRTDILFRMYILMSGNKEAWKCFCGLRSNRKVNYKSIYKLRDSINRVGLKSSIKVIRDKDIWYPASGATRIACMWSLHQLQIRVNVHTLPSLLKWNDYKGLKSHHFALDNSVVDEFVSFFRENRQVFPSRVESNLEFLLEREH